ncbi:uncharacterized protein [Musca autumnalis]|uniref:uncharacterized protein n=1 Tax=Musca autumnalis TaxID=221902 RepID=UPI003CFAEC3D
MTSPAKCQLCIKDCTDYGTLYEKSSQPSKLFDVVVSFFHPMFLQIRPGRNYAVICSDCWKIIYHFRRYQHYVISCQKRLFDYEQQLEKTNLRKRSNSFTNQNRSKRRSVDHNNAVEISDENSAIDLCEEDNSSCNSSCNSSSPMVCHTKESGTISLSASETASNQANSDISRPSSIGSYAFSDIIDDPNAPEHAANGNCLNESISSTNSPSNTSTSGGIENFQQCNSGVDNLANVDGTISPSNVNPLMSSSSSIGHNKDTNVDQISNENTFMSNGSNNNSTTSSPTNFNQSNPNALDYGNLTSNNHKISSDPRLASKSTTNHQDVANPSIVTSCHNLSPNGNCHNTFTQNVIETGYDNNSSPKLGENNGSNTAFQQSNQNNLEDNTLNNRLNSPGPIHNQNGVDLPVIASSYSLSPNNDCNNEFMGKGNTSTSILCENNSTTSSTNAFPSPLNDVNLTPNEGHISATTISNGLDSVNPPIVTSSYGIGSNSACNNEFTPDAGNHNTSTPDLCEINSTSSGQDNANPITTSSYSNSFNSLCSNEFAKDGITNECQNNPSPNLDENNSSRNSFLNFSLTNLNQINENALEDNLHSNSDYAIAGLKEKESLTNLRKNNSSRNLCFSFSPTNVNQINENGLEDNLYSNKDCASAGLKEKDYSTNLIENNSSRKSYFSFSPTNLNQINENALDDNNLHSAKDCATTDLNERDNVSLPIITSSFSVASNSASNNTFDKHFNNTEQQATSTPNVCSNHPSPNAFSQSNNNTLEDINSFSNNCQITSSHVISNTHCATNAHGLNFTNGLCSEFPTTNNQRRDNNSSEVNSLEALNTPPNGSPVQQHINANVESNSIRQYPSLNHTSADPRVRNEIFSHNNGPYTNTHSGNPPPMTAVPHLAESSRNNNDNTTPTGNYQHNNETPSVIVASQNNVPNIQIHSRNNEIALMPLLRQPISESSNSDERNTTASGDYQSNGSPIDFESNSMRQYPSTTHHYVNPRVSNEIFSHNNYRDGHGERPSPKTAIPHHSESSRNNNDNETPTGNYQHNIETPSVIVASHNNGPNIHIHSSNNETVLMPLLRQPISEPSNNNGTNTTASGDHQSNGSPIGQYLNTNIESNSMRQYPSTTHHYANPRVSNEIFSHSNGPYTNTHSGNPAPTKPNFAESGSSNDTNTISLVGNYQHNIETPSMVITSQNNGPYVHNQSSNSETAAMTSLRQPISEPSNNNDTNTTASGDHQPNGSLIGQYLNTNIESNSMRQYPSTIHTYADPRVSNEILSHNNGDTHGERSAPMTGESCRNNNNNMTPNGNYTTPPEDHHRSSDVASEIEDSTSSRSPLDHMTEFSNRSTQGNTDGNVKPNFTANNTESITSSDEVISILSDSEDEYEEPIGVIFGGDFSDDMPSDQKSPNETDCNTEQSKDGSISNESTSTTSSTVIVSSKAGDVHPRYSAEDMATTPVSKEQVSYVPEQISIACNVCLKQYPSFHNLQQHYREEHWDGCPDYQIDSNKEQLNPCVQEYSASCNNSLNNSNTTLYPIPNLPHNMEEAFISSHPFKCSLCRIIFPDEQQLKEHFVRVHASNPLQCSICHVVYPDQLQLKEHFLRKHIIKSYLELKQNSLNNGQISEELDEFIARYHSNVQCNICNLTFIRFSELEKHFHLQHPHASDGLHILCCGLKFSNRLQLLEHICWHLDPNYFTCDLCNVCHSTIQSLTGHFQFNHPQQYEELMARLHQKKPDVRITHQEIDEFIEQNMPPTQCGICNERSSTFLELKVHFRLMHSTDHCRISCCGRKWHGRYEIEEHILHHKNPNAFKCSECKRTYSTRYNFYLHKRKCQKFYTNKNAARVEKEKKYDEYIAEYLKSLQCPTCHQTFEKFGPLKAHYLKNHRGLKFNVFCCNQAFDHRTYFLKHLKMYHVPLK